MIVKLSKSNFKNGSKPKLPTSNLKPSKKTKLSDITDVIRSKNSGPYELTFDIMFTERETYEKVCAAKIFNTDTVCSLFGIGADDIINIIEFDPANAIKITIKRSICSGDIGETDVYGAQQHAPLLYFELDL